MSRLKPAPVFTQKPVLSRATEVCSCGARIEIETIPISLGYRLEEWRKSHRHEMPRGEQNQDSVPKEDV